MNFWRYRHKERGQGISVRFFCVGLLQFEKKRLKKRRLAARNTLILRCFQNFKNFIWADESGVLIRLNRMNFFNFLKFFFGN